SRPTLPAASSAYHLPAPFRSALCDANTCTWYAPPSEGTETSAVLPPGTEYTCGSSCDEPPPPGGGSSDSPECGGGALGGGELGGCPCGGGLPRTRWCGVVTDAERSAVCVSPAR